MVVIALSGWKGAGKDTVADYLVRKYGCIKVSFADKLKDLVAKLYGLPRDYFDDPQYKEAALLQLPVQLETLAELTTDMPEVVQQFKSRGTPCWTPRALCIFVANKMRLVDPECWIKAALADLEPKLNNYVISDLRYPNELKWLDHFGGKDNVTTVRVRRDQTIYSSGATVGSAVGVDPSEHSLDDFKFDYYLDNNGDLAELEQAVDRFWCAW